MNDAVNHSPNLGSVGQGEGLMEPLESETPNGLLLIAGSPDHTPNPFDGNRFLHIGPLQFSAVGSCRLSATSSGAFN